MFQIQWKCPRKNWRGVPKTQPLPKSPRPSNFDPLRFDPYINQSIALDICIPITSNPYGERGMPSKRYINCTFLVQPSFHVLLYLLPNSDVVVHQSLRGGAGRYRVCICRASSTPVPTFLSFPAYLLPESDVFVQSLRGGVGR